MKESKKNKIHRMEVEDDQGISRKKKYKFTIPLKTYRIIKLCLILSIPVVYFIYSPLLILIMVAYFAMYFITRRAEKVMNAGLRKDLHTYLPKFDSILALLIIVLTCVSIGVSAAASKQKSSMFTGMNNSEISDTMDNKDFSKTNFTWFRIKSKIQDVSTLLTGERVFFQSEKRFGKGGTGPSDFSGSAPDEDSESHEKPDISEMMQNIPFSMIFQSVLKSVNTVLIFLVSACGVITLIKIRKIEG